MNPSKVTFGPNKPAVPAEFSHTSYYDPSDTFPEAISSVFADEEIHDELRGYALPAKYLDVRNDHHSLLTFLITKVYTPPVTLLCRISPQKFVYECKGYTG
jgi:hypothetical protein